MAEASIPELSPDEVRKAKQRERNRQYSMHNRDKINARKRGYRLSADTETIAHRKALSSAANKRYRARNPERLRLSAQQQWRDPEKRQKKEAYNKAYLESEQGKKTKAAWHARNKHKTRASYQAYMRRKRQRDPEGIRAKQRALYAANATWRAQQALGYRLANPERTKESQKKYQQTHPVEMKIKNHLRRARKKNAPINDFTKKQFRALCKSMDYRCCYCQKKFSLKELTPDHLTPYAKNGSNTLHNILPCCLACNVRKNVRDVLTPVQPFLLVDESAAD